MMMINDDHLTQDTKTKTQQQPTMLVLGGVIECNWFSLLSVKENVSLMLGMNKSSKKIAGTTNVP